MKNLLFCLNYSFNIPYSLPLIVTLFFSRYILHTIPHHFRPHVVDNCSRVLSTMDSFLNFHHSLTLAILSIDLLSVRSVFLVVSCLSGVRPHTDVTDCVSFLQSHRYHIVLSHVHMVTLLQTCQLIRLNV